MLSSEAPARRPILVPEGGPENPLFEELEFADTVDATILFERTLAEVELDIAEDATQSWFGTADWGGVSPTLLQETLTPTCLHVAVTGVRTSRAAFAGLVAALQGARIGVARAVFARRRADGDRDALVKGMDPTARPQVEYDNPREWWRACFDPSVAPPLSEDRAELSHDDDALLEVGDTTFAERRGLPLHLQDVRICYGLADVTYEAADIERSAVRPSGSPAHRGGEEVARALCAALADRFRLGDGAAPSTPEDRSARPVFYNRERAPEAPLDGTRAHGRVGYSCAFRAPDLREFLHEHLFRYREYELMLALRDVVRALDLEPVICWRRVHGRYVIQLWERGASRVGVAA